MNSPITGKPMELVTQEETIVSYKGFDYFVELEAYYCEESDMYYTNKIIQEKNINYLEFLNSQKEQLKSSVELDSDEIQKVYNIIKNFNLSKFKKYYVSVILQK